MNIEVVKSKIHRVTVTEADLNYIGSITIDEDLMDAANIIENEKVQVVNINNGERLETYVIKGERGSGETLACGTGACAAVVSGINLGLIESPVEVKLRGGKLDIEWSGEGTPVFMTGPAEYVYEGSYEMEKS